jgi:hypothetical protein
MQGSCRVERHHGADHGARGRRRSCCRLAPGSEAGSRGQRRRWMQGPATAQDAGGRRWCGMQGAARRGMQGSGGSTGCRGPPVARDAGAAWRGMQGPAVAWDAGVQQRCGMQGLAAARDSRDGSVSGCRGRQRGHQGASVRRTWPSRLWEGRGVAARREDGAQPPARSMRRGRRRGGRGTTVSREDEVRPLLGNLVGEWRGGKRDV